MPAALERKLKAEAKKKGLTGKRAGAYIWGTMRKTGWTPSTQKENMTARDMIDVLCEDDDHKQNTGLHGKAAKSGFTEADADPEQLRMGVIVEMEHTDDPEISKTIALDHLSEKSEYYTILKNAGLADELEADAGEEV